MVTNLLYVVLLVTYSLLVIGWCISACGILQLPVWALYAIYNTEADTLYEKIAMAFRPTSDWGPIDPELYKLYQHDMHRRKQTQRPARNVFVASWRNVFD